MSEQEELYEIGQDNEDLDIDLLGDLSSFDIIDVREQEGFEYPAMLISGVNFKDSLRVLQSIKRESYRSYDVWVDLGDGTPPVKQGTLPMDLPTLLAMRYLGLNVTLYGSEEAIVSLNLKDVDTLVNFI